MSFSGPPEAWVTGITPAALQTGRQRVCCQGKKSGTCHEFHDIDTEVLVDHGAQTDTSSREPVEHHRERSVENELYVILTTLVRSESFVVYG